MLPWSVGMIDLLSTYAHYIFFWACGSCIAACGALRFVKLCTPFHQVCAWIAQSSRVGWRVSKLNNLTMTALDFLQILGEKITQVESLP
jgi:hypothetical protein